MAAAVPGSPSGGLSSGVAGLSAVFFDFDSTLSIPQWLGRFDDFAVADRLDMMLVLNEEEIHANFGGKARIDRLSEMFRCLQQSGAVIFIVSLGFTEVIGYHLKVAGLSSFFPPDRIYGQDSQELRAVQHQKAKLIESLMQMHGWRPARALFVDDSKKHIDLCSERQTCSYLLVQDHGLSEEEMQAIEHAAGKPD